MIIAILGFIAFPILVIWAIYRLHKESEDYKGVTYSWEIGDKGKHYREFKANYDKQLEREKKAKERREARKRYYDGYDD